MTTGLTPFRSFSSFLFFLSNRRCLSASLDVLSASLAACMIVLRASRCCRLLFFCSKDILSEAVRLWAAAGRALVGFQGRRPLELGTTMVVGVVGGVGGAALTSMVGGVEGGDWREGVRCGMSDVLGMAGLVGDSQANYSYGAFIEASHRRG